MANKTDLEENKNNNVILEENNNNDNNVDPEKENLNIIDKFLNEIWNSNIANN